MKFILICILLLTAFALSSGRVNRTYAKRRPSKSKRSYAYALEVNPKNTNCYVDCVRDLGVTGNYNARGRIITQRLSPLHIAGYCKGSTSNAVMRSFGSCNCLWKGNQWWLEHFGDELYHTMINRLKQACHNRRSN